MMNKNIFKCALAVAFFFMACADDSTEVVIEKMNVVADVAELPECDASNEGEQAIVKGESSIRVCVDGDWFVTAGETVLGDDEVESVQLDSLVGYSQKGPFLKGSTVYLYELSDGRTLKQTNGNFTSNITSDDGRFKFTARNLVSQYALLVVSGKYRNEVTGDPTPTAIQLQAYTDVLNRKMANVNLITHLEHDRVYNLVTRENLRMKVAKRQARFEILNEFHIDTTGFKGSSEDWDVFGSTDADAALLAISILLQGDSSETALSVRLTEMGDDLATDGLWNDSKAESEKARIADWAMAADSAGRYAKFRKNVEGWKLSKTVPDFEKHMRHFWATNYGIDDCTKKREGEIVATKNKKSAVYGTTTRFICKSGLWKVAEDIVVDTKGWKDGSDGKLKKGDVTERFYKFDEKLDKWLYATKNDSTLGLKGCTEKRDGAIEKSSKSGNFYHCTESDWVELTDAIAYDTLGIKCSSANYGGIMAGAVEKENKYYCTSEGWVSLMSWNWNVPKEIRLNPNVKYDSIIDSRDNKVYRTVVIGEGENAQTWMAENLNYNDSVETPSLKGKSWCYDNLASNCDVAGRLYLWSAAIDSTKIVEDKENPMVCGLGKKCNIIGNVQGICPDGWHLPSLADIISLVNNVEAFAATKVLKSQTGWNKFKDDNGKIMDAYGTDAVGFSGIPTGMMRTSRFGMAGEAACFWTSSDYSFYDAYMFCLADDNNTRSDITDSFEKNVGMSVRCIKNK